MDYYILAINPGSTSTKIALYKNEERVFAQTIDHSPEEIEGWADHLAEFEARKALIEDQLAKHGFDATNLSAVVGRGGMLPPVKAGGYLVNEAMKEIIWSGKISKHASNFGALLADAIAGPLSIPAYIYDAVSTDEIRDIAKITGVPEITRHPYCHVLNTKAVSRKVAQEMGKSYEEVNFVVAHLGGGISISAHQKGVIVDVIEDDGGPFSPERSGSIPLQYIVDMCYSGEYNKAQFKRKLRGMGGMKAHLGTHDCREIEKMIAGGDEYAKKVYQAQAYQIAKGIGEMSPTIDGKIDAIILTGGVANSKMLTDWIVQRVSFIAPIIIVPGENELESLAFGALRILKGEELPSEFI